MKEGAVFCAVFDSRSSFFAPKLHGNACYAGYGTTQTTMNTNILTR